MNNNKPVFAPGQLGDLKRLGPAINSGQIATVKKVTSGEVEKVSTPDLYSTVPKEYEEASDFPWHVLVNDKPVTVTVRPYVPGETTKPPGKDLVIIVQKAAEINQQMREKLVQTGLNAKGRDGIMKATLLLEEMLRGMCKRTTLFQIMKKRILEASRSQAKAAIEKPLFVPIEQHLWISEADYQKIKDENGIYPMGRFSGKRGRIEAKTEFPDQVSAVSDPTIDSEAFFELPSTAFRPETRPEGNRSLLQPATGQKQGSTAPPARPSIVSKTAASSGSAPMRNKPIPPKPGQRPSPTSIPSRPGGVRRVDNRRFGG